MAPERRMFLYMPLMHSEQLADQNASVCLFEAAGLEANVYGLKQPLFNQPDNLPN